jgi:hypothetical protein
MAMMGVPVRKVLSLTTLVVISATVLSGALAAGASAATTAAVSGGSPMIRATGSSYGLPTISENWSGYAATSSKPFTYASTEFVEPTVTCSLAHNTDVYTSNWVGLDGFNDQTVEQDGTSGFCAPRHGTTPTYYAWIEMYPAATVREYDVAAGDVISASVAYATGGTFTLTVSDLTSGMSKSVSATCASCARASAEWIVERPAGCNPFPTNCYLFALAKFTPATMFDNVATVEGGTPTGLGSLPHAHQIIMVQPTKKGGFYALDNVSGLNQASNAFTVTWVKYGLKTPITLGPRQ